MGSIFFHKGSGKWVARGDILVYCESKRIANKVLDEMDELLAPVKETIRKKYPLFTKDWVTLP